MKNGMTKSVMVLMGLIAMLATSSTARADAEDGSGRNCREIGYQEGFIVGDKEGQSAAPDYSTHPATSVTHRHYLNGTQIGRDYSSRLREFGCSKHGARNFYAGFEEGYPAGLRNAYLAQRFSPSRESGRSGEIKIADESVGRPDLTDVSESTTSESMPGGADRGL